LLAKAVGQPTSMSADRLPSRASSLPQGCASSTGIVVHTKQLWERACSRWRHHISHHCDRPTAIASEPAPTGFRVVHWNCGTHQSNVGVSLLAMALGQPTSMSADRLPSRASPLPQGSASSTGIAVHTKQLWERACSRWRWVSQHPCRLTDCLREQARSHRVPRRPLKLRHTQNNCGSELARDGVGSANTNVD